MADDLTLPASGAIVATDEVSSRHYQLVKQAFGADGSAELVAADNGLPVQSGYKELSGSASANNTDLVSADVSGYRWVSVQITGTFSANATFQASNDNVNWIPFQLNVVSTSTFSGLTSQTNFTTGIWVGPLTARYVRVRCTSYTSGTISAVVGLWANTSVWPAVPITPVGTVSVTGTTNITDASSLNGAFGVPVLAGGFGYNGATWDRARNPNVVKTVAATASGNTALWQPGSGNRWRLQRVKIDLSGDAAIDSGGVLTIELRDGSTAIGVTQSPYVPATGGTALGGWSSGWIDLGNGIQSSANNQDLNVNLSAALTAGTCRVVACGTQGSGTAA